MNNHFDSNNPVPSTSTHNLLNAFDTDLNLIPNCIKNLNYVTCTDFNAEYSKCDQNDGLFTVFGLNVQSLHAHHSNLESMIHNLNYCPDVICLSETWIQDGQEKLYSIENYTTIGNNLGKKRNDHGGVMFYIKNGIPFSRRPDL